MQKLLSCFVLCFTKKKSLYCQDTGDGTNLNQSETEDDFSDARVKDQKPAGGFKNWGTCSIPCDVTVKLLRDEKHSICGKNFLLSCWHCFWRHHYLLLSVYVCLCVSTCSSVAAVSAGVRSQHPQTDQGRDGGAAAGTGHPEQSGKVEFCPDNKVWKRVTVLLHAVISHFFRSQSWWSKCRRSALRYREATLRCILANRCNPTVTFTQNSHNNKTFTHIDDKCWRISGSLLL